MEVNIAMTALLALGAPPTPPGTQADPRGQMLYTVGMLLFMVFIFYFLIIRPQRVRAKNQENLLKAIKPGDKVVTSSGIMGTVSLQSIGTCCNCLPSDSAGKVNSVTLWPFRNRKIPQSFPANRAALTSAIRVDR